MDVASFRFRPGFSPVSAVTAARSAFPPPGKVPRTNREEIAPTPGTGGTESNVSRTGHCAEAPIVLK